MLRVAFVLRSTEVHPEFCGLSSPFFSNSYIQLCYWGSLAGGAVVVLVVPSSSLCLLCASLGTTITTALHLLLLEGCAVLHAHEYLSWPSYGFSGEWGKPFIQHFTFAMSLCYWGSLAYAR